MPQWKQGLVSYLGDRDNWTCGICGKPAPKELRGKDHPLAPTIGHIVPLSRGGDYRESNLRCEHYSCNQAKKDLLDHELIYKLGLLGSVNAEVT